jgi:hypothetical protein
MIFRGAEKQRLLATLRQTEQTVGATSKKEVIE